MVIASEVALRRLEIALWSHRMKFLDELEVLSNGARLTMHPTSSLTYPNPGQICQTVRFTSVPVGANLSHGRHEPRFDMIKWTDLNLEAYKLRSLPKCPLNPPVVRYASPQHYPAGFSR